MHRRESSGRRRAETSRVKRSREVSSGPSTAHSCCARSRIVRGEQPRVLRQEGQAARDRRGERREERQLSRESRAAPDAAPPRAARARGSRPPRRPPALPPPRRAPRTSSSSRRVAPARERPAGSVARRGDRNRRASRPQRARAPDARPAPTRAKPCGSTTGTRATIGVGRKCTTTENTSCSTSASVTARPSSRPAATAAATALRLRSAMASGLSTCAALRDAEATSEASLLLGGCRRKRTLFTACLPLRRACSASTPQARTTGS